MQEIESSSLRTVYLDQNMWIALSKAELGQSGGLRFRPALESARRLLRDGSAIFPLSFAHLLETFKIANLEQRARLAHLMVELSQGWFLTAPSFLILGQLRHQLGIKYGKKTTHWFDEKLFTKDIFEALGRGAQKLMLQTMPGAADMFQSLLKLENFLASGPRLEPSMLNHQIEIAKRREVNRVDMSAVSVDIRRRIYYAQLMCESTEELFEALRSLEIERDVFFKTNLTQAEEFVRGIPVFDVESTLALSRNSHREKAIAVNDEIDIGFLSLAIPACDVVLTEKFWSNVAVSKKLDRKYSTIVSANLLSLQQYVEHFPYVDD